MQAHNLNRALVIDPAHQWSFFLPCINISCNVAVLVDWFLYKLQVGSAEWHTLGTTLDSRLWLKAGRQMVVFFLALLQHWLCQKGLADYQCPSREPGSKRDLLIKKKMNAMWNEKITTTSVGLKLTTSRSSIPWFNNFIFVPDKFG